MDVLAALRPLTKTSVYEVLRELGFDLSSWAVNANGRANKNPAVNGRAYAWSYKDEKSKQDVFMLWYEDMAEFEGRVRYLQNWHGVVAELDATRPITARRADDFLRHVSNLKIGALVRVGIVEGSRAASSSDTSSEVARRVLDPEMWHLSRWEPLTSTYEFTRGLPNIVNHYGAAQRDLTSGSDAASQAPESEIVRDLADILAESDSPTEKERLIAARLGQGKFRSAVLERWGNKCAVTGSTTLAAIRASHCMPWRSGTNQQRLDPANGLPLVATLDALFDVGLIGFDEKGVLVVSSQLRDEAIDLSDLRLAREPSEDESAYLAHHRLEIFKP